MRNVPDDIVWKFVCADLEIKHLRNALRNLPEFRTRVVQVRRDLDAIFKDVKQKFWEAPDDGR